LESTAIEMMRISLDDLQKGLVIRYGAGEQTFSIPGNELTDWILEKFVEVQRRKVTANLN
jgi:hypothetical protein